MRRTLFLAPLVALVALVGIAGPAVAAPSERPCAVAQGHSARLLDRCPAPVVPVTHTASLTGIVQQFENWASTLNDLLPAGAVITAVGPVSITSYGGDGNIGSATHTLTGDGTQWILNVYNVDIIPVTWHVDVTYTLPAA